MLKCDGRKHFTFAVALTCFSSSNTRSSITQGTELSQEMLAEPMKSWEAQERIHLDTDNVRRWGNKILITLMSSTMHVPTPSHFSIFLIKPEMERYRPQ